MEKLIKYFCKDCGRIYEIDLEEDEFTTKITCAYCHKKMYKIKDGRNNKPNKSN